MNVEDEKERLRNILEATGGSPRDLQRSVMVLGKVEETLRTFFEAGNVRKLHVSQEFQSAAEKEANRVGVMVRARRELISEGV